MTKKFLVSVGFLMFALAFSFGIAKPVLACDPLGCLLAGKDQDILAIVTVESVDGEVATVTADYYHELSKIRPSGSFTVDFSNGAPWVLYVPEIGKHYFISLACEDTICTPKWGAWEVDSVNYKETKLLEIRNGDDAAIQWIVQGNVPDFFSEEDRTYVKTPDGVFEIYPEYKMVTGQDQSIEEKEKSDFLKWFFVGLLGSIIVTVFIGLRIKNKKIINL